MLATSCVAFCYKKQSLKLYIVTLFEFDTNDHIMQEGQKLKIEFQISGHRFGLQASMSTLRNNHNQQNLIL